MNQWIWQNYLNGVINLVKHVLKDVINLSKQSEEYRFITELYCVTEPKKLLGKVSFQKFEYKESDEDDQR